MNKLFVYPKLPGTCLSCALGCVVMLAIAGLTASAQSIGDPALPASTPAPKPVSATPSAAAPEAIKIAGLTISGSIRARFESWNWFDVNPAVADDSYNFGAVQLRLAIGQAKERFEWQVEGEAPALIGLPSRAIAPAPQGQLGLGATYFAANGNRGVSGLLKQAFVRFKGLFGDDASSLKLGRFDFNDGAEVTPSDASLAAVKRDHIQQRLIGAFGFSHVGRSFDGLLYNRNSAAGDFTFFGARPTAGAFDLNANKELGVDLWYGAFTKPLKHKTGESEYRLFVLHYHDGRRVLKTDNRPLAVRAADLDNTRITTLGGHYIGVYKTGAGKTDLLLWGAAQVGNFGRLDQRAGAIAAEAGYQFGGKVAQKIKPWIRGGYFRSTGDNNPADDTHGTFFQVLPTPRIYARFPFFNLMNNEDAFGQLMLKPHAKLNLRFDVHHLRLSSRNDLWYSGGGAFQRQTFGYTGRPSNGKQSLGTMLDFSADYKVASRTTLTFYLSGVKGGSVESAIYPLGKDARYCYFELLQRF